MGKKTLYLDLDAVDSLIDSLQRLPGRPSLSSYLNEQLPTMAVVLARMVSEAEKSGLRGAASLFQSAADELRNLDSELREVHEDPNPLFVVPLSDLAGLPPKKAATRRPGKSAEPADIPPKKAPRKRPAKSAKT